MEEGHSNYRIEVIGSEFTLRINGILVYNIHIQTPFYLMFYLLFCSIYKLYDDKGKKIGTLKRFWLHKYRFEFYNENGEINMFTWYRERLFYIFSKQPRFITDESRHAILTTHSKKTACYKDGGVEIYGDIENHFTTPAEFTYKFLNAPKIPDPFSLMLCCLCDKLLTYNEW